MTKWTFGSFVLCAALLAGASLQAHHSLAGMYALGKEAKVAGAFKAFRLVNPHSAMKFDVKNTDGSVTEWNVLGGSVQAIGRLGLKSGPNALKPGDEIAFTQSAVDLMQLVGKYMFGGGGQPPANAENPPQNAPQNPQTAPAPQQTPTEETP